MDQWLYYYQVWLIISVVFLLLELTDGSLIVFLPIGIGASLMSLFILFTDNTSIIQWYLLFLIWALISALCSFILSKLWKRGINNKDINDY
tara:strand:+ start:349 stop:621 length:273 start_codon:yes stop_codon:yes gene_type:complete